MPLCETAYENVTTAEPALFSLPHWDGSLCAVDTYRKPFDLIFQKAKTEEWRAQGDDSGTFLSEFVSSVPQDSALSFSLKRNSSRKLSPLEAFFRIREREEEYGRLSDEREIVQGAVDYEGDTGSTSLGFFKQCDFHHQNNDQAMRSVLSSEKAAEKLRAFLLSAI